MSCCAAGTESAAELEALKSDGPSAEEMWLSSRVLGNGMRQIDLIVPGVHCGACIALLEKELPKTPGVDHARVNLSTRRVSVVFGDQGPNGGSDHEAVLGQLWRAVQGAWLSGAPARWGR
jgi:Cu2+-exporting ATPase